MRKIYQSNDERAVARYFLYLELPSQKRYTHSTSRRRTTIVTTFYARKKKKKKTEHVLVIYDTQ